ncbi:MAG: LPS export ABC transporter periplasmic protein LptC [Candidatus Omnitrophica bacterium]|nr:LPS export ABC transporter periplasmic protein LptC [Candidatus Omnitrophota bacterium]
MRKWTLLFIFILLGLTPTVYGLENAEQKFQGFNLQGYTDEGEKSWDVEGDTADINGAEITLKNVVANSYGERPMNVTADTGVVNQTTGKMTLEDDVVITSDDGSKLMTDFVEWDKEQDLVSSDKDVYIKNESFAATGTGMRAQPGLKNAQLNKDVTVRVDTAEPQKETTEAKVPKLLTITSDGPMTLDQLLLKARFEVNVTAEQDNQTLKADIMEIYFKEGMKEVKEMVCLGNVEIIQGENKTFAEKATYNAEDQKLTLSGRPKLILETGGQSGLTPLGN